MKLSLIILGLGLTEAAQVFLPNVFSDKLVPNVFSDELVVSVRQTRRSCLELGYSNDSGLKLHAGLKFNNATVVNREIAVRKFCSPLRTPVGRLQGCLDVYYADIDVKNKTADACFLVELGVPWGGTLLQVRFNCFRFQDGKFERHAKVAAPSSGILSVGLADGRPSISFNRPDLSLPKLSRAITNFFG